MIQIDISNNGLIFDSIQLEMRKTVFAQHCINLIDWASVTLVFIGLQGCRDLLRLLFEKSQSIPAVDNTCTMTAVDSVYNVSVTSCYCRDTSRLHPLCLFSKVASRPSS